MSVSLGLDVGGTNFRVGVVSGCRVLSQSRREADFSLLCRSLPADAALSAILDSIGAGIEEALHSHPEASAIGIGFPGFIDPATRRISLSPNLPGLADVDLLSPLREKFSLPVVLENDANAAAYGEYMLLPAGSKNLVYAGLGTGIGGGLVLSGRPYAGENGVAMEIGHLVVEPGGRPCGCGNKGCMERYASASGVVMNFQGVSGKTLDAREIAGLARAGDQKASAAFSLAGEKLGQGLAHILKVVDVSTVVIGGGLIAAWDLLSEACLRRLDADLVPAQRGKISLHLSKSGDDAGMIGAALLALKNPE